MSRVYINSSKTDNTRKYSTLVFIIQGSNIQVFFKVLKDLKKENFDNVCLIYFDKSVDNLPFLSEIEYWIKTTKWTIDVMVSNDAPKDWKYLEGDINSSIAYRKIPDSNSSTAVFASVYNAQKAEISDKLDTKGYKTKQVFWIN